MEIRPDICLRHISFFLTGASALIQFTHQAKHRLRLLELVVLSYITDRISASPVDGKIYR